MIYHKVKILSSRCDNLKVAEAELNDFIKQIDNDPNKKYIGIQFKSYQQYSIPFISAFIEYSERTDDSK